MSDKLLFPLEHIPARTRAQTVADSECNKRDTCLRPLLYNSLGDTQDFDQKVTRQEDFQKGIEYTFRGSFSCRSIPDTPVFWTFVFSTAYTVLF